MKKGYKSVQCKKLYVVLNKTGSKFKYLYKNTVPWRIETAE